MTIRVIHHWACSGGTIISRCIAAQPRVVLLSEVHPLAHLRLATASTQYSPTDIIQQLSLPHNGKDPALCLAAWNGAIDALAARLEKDQKILVLRSHSQIDFFTGPTALDEPSVRRSLAPRHRMLELITVRHPLDSWLSIRLQGWAGLFRFSNLAEFCRRCLLMLSACGPLPVLRYEDFTLDAYQSLIQICSWLELAPPVGGLDALENLQLSGNSGRAGDKVGPRARRPIPPEVLTELQAELLLDGESQGEISPYLELCSRLGYDPDPSAHYPFTTSSLASLASVIPTTVR